jgi:C4-dicarboxylate-specific signal transduction histidine kinase
MIIWSLVSIALLLGAGFLIISYIYQLQDNTKQLIRENALSTDDARELRLALYRVRAASLSNVFDRSDEKIQLLENEQRTFLALLNKAGSAANTPEQIRLVQQISALFSNYQQTLLNTNQMQRQGKLTQPATVIVMSSQDLINTIEEKTNQLIAAKETEQLLLEKRISRNETIITTAIYALGTSGIIMGLILGWLVARIVLNPIYRLVLKVRDAAGGEVVEQIQMHSGKELEELDMQINRLISRINKANEDLRKNRELLEQSIRLAAIGKIAPALAHEIRNPLTSIKILVHNMMDEFPEQSEQRQDLKIIQTEVIRMEEFLQNFMKYARPPRPKMEIISPAELIDQVLQLMEARFKMHQIDVETFHQNPSLRLKADHSMIKQVIINLLNNATEQLVNGGRIEIRTGLVQKENTEHYFISIADNGPGIPPEIINTMWEPFVKGREQGTGLGLSISQRIAEMHHGSLTAANGSQGGATFTLYLPLEM